MRVLLWILGLILAAAIAFGAAAYWWWSELTQPFDHGHPEAVISIERGASTEEIIGRLKQAGVIKNDLALKIYLRVKRSHAKMKAGDYSFPSPISTVDVLTLLEKGGKEHGRLTVIEGWTKFDVAKAMKNLPSLNLKSEAEAMALLNDTTAIAALDPKATSLEGYLFPDTYFLEVDTTAKGLVSHMVDRFKAVYKENLEKDIAASGLSLHSVVTIASIIETEAKLAAERPVVASVIYNRVRINMKLSMDSTIVYASKMAGKWRYDGKVYQSDLNRDSPYNSRKYAGLPPGPVSCPGLSSLQAAIHPAQTNYLYYVRNPDRNDGAHNYYSSAAEFDKGVEALRRWEKEQHRKGLR